jgi:hypothetical protein
LFVEYKEEYYVQVSNMFAVLEDLDAEVDTKNLWEMIREIILISAKECLTYHEFKKIKETSQIAVVI